MKKHKDPDFDRGHGSVHPLCSLSSKLSLALKHARAMCPRNPQAHWHLVGFQFPELF